MKTSTHFQSSLLTAANLCAFLGFAWAIEHFGIHHHWVLVWIPGLLALELAALEWGGAPAMLRHNVLWTAVITAFIGAGRFQTIFACFEHCYFKLTAMHLLTALVLAAPFLVWRQAEEKRAAQWALLFVLGAVWALSRGFSAWPWA